MALHHDLLMVAVPNNFTRNQLEIRFRTDIERLLSGYFGRNISWRSSSTSRSSQPT